MDRYEQIAEKILSEIHGIEKPVPAEPKEPLARVDIAKEPTGPVIIAWDELGNLH